MPMLTITQHHVDRNDLVVLVGHDGLVEWSSHRDRDDVVEMLRNIADAIEDGTPAGRSTTTSPQPNASASCRPHPSRSPTRHTGDRADRCRTGVRRGIPPGRAAGGPRELLDPAPCLANRAGHRRTDPP